MGVPSGEKETDSGWIRRRWLKEFPDNTITWWHFRTHLKYQMEQLGLSRIEEDGKNYGRLSRLSQSSCLLEYPKWDGLGIRAGFGNGKWADPSPRQFGSDNWKATAS